MSSFIDPFKEALILIQGLCVLGLLLAGGFGFRKREPPPGLCFFSKCGFRDTGVISIGVEGFGLRTHILRLWGLRTILYKALGLFLSPWVLVL